MRLFLIIFSFIYSLTISAFTLSTSTGAKFSDSEITIDVAGGNTCINAGFNSPEELLDKVEEAIDEYWNRIPTCALQLKKGSVRSDVDWSSINASSIPNSVYTAANSGTILVGCSDTGFPNGTLAVASINSNTQNQGFVLINNSSTTFANLDDQEKLATIAHEIGHAFGLGHSSDETALMYYSIGGKIQEKLTIDDYDACSYLYPHSAPASCSSVGPISKTPTKGNGQKEYNHLFSLLFGFFALMLSFSILRYHRGYNFKS